jgi:hypothetical protein
LSQVFDDFKADAVNPENQSRSSNKYFESAAYLRKLATDFRATANTFGPPRNEYYLEQAAEMEAKAVAAEKWDTQWGDAYRQLKGNLTEAEWEAARLSTINAHFTSPEVIRAMWSAVTRLGFRGGKVLEPAGGIGHFFGLMPEGAADRSRLTGVELDSLTARIFRKLYPEADIIESGYQVSGIANGTQDLVISNVPFANLFIADPALDAMGAPKLSLHNYFFAKALQHVKPGGLLAFITTAHTADSNMAQRKFIAQHGDLVGMIRLPNDAFRANAGTDVVTDIIFLRKPDGTPFRGEAWTDTRKVPAGEGKEAEINQYFAKYPEMVLGRLAMDGSMYGGKEEMTVHPTGDLYPALAAAIDRLPENIMGEGKANDAARAVANTSIHKAGSLRYKEDGTLEFYGSKNPPPTQILADDFIAVREALRELYDAELTPGSTDALGRVFGSGKVSPSAAASATVSETMLQRRR